MKTRDQIYSEFLDFKKQLATDLSAHCSSVQHITRIGVELDVVDDYVFQLLYHKNLYK